MNGIRLMLIEFTVENFRSFRERATLSMIAAKLRARAPQVDQNNVVAINNNLSLLRSAVIYGANASGKSNLIKALAFMREFVVNSARQQDEDPIRVEPFLLRKDVAEQPSFFEVIFLLDGLQYRYGFSATKQRVVEEWLYYTPTTREVELFTRDTEGIYPGEQFRVGRLTELDLENKLFLSVVAQFAKRESKAGATAKRVRDWFITTCRPLTALHDEAYLPFTLDCIEEGRYRHQLERIVRSLDLDITGLAVDEVPMPAMLAKIYDVVNHGENQSTGNPAQLALPGMTGNRMMKELRTRHKIRDADGNIETEIDFAAPQMESEGTQKLIALTGPLLDVLAHGWVLFLDEIDSRLHPLITAAILRLFNSPETNPKNAQLVCITHDTNLLDRHVLRRDQIYFVEKDRQASSHLYSLADFKLGTDGANRKVRNDQDFEKNYIQGRYGAIPYLGDLSQLFIEETRLVDEIAAPDSSFSEVFV
jgi:uncharacterized protein